MSEYILELRNIYKSFDDTEVLKDINLQIKEGEFITILGPSGCGKTTTLRIIAGLEEADKGSVLLEGVDVTNLEPNKRNVNTIFQDYALFPHMTVGENIAYSQKLKKLPVKEIEEKVKEVLDLVQLSGYENRSPSQLSGGQAQRVAIARAIINKPKVLLLDEPLGALDLQLRRQMQSELKSLQKLLGITFIYITHDQDEAMAMSDRIVVMHKGNFEQIDDPMSIYRYPKTSFIATFIGSSNLIEGKVLDVLNKEVLFETKTGQGVVHLIKGQEEDKLQIGDKIKVAIRAEDILFNLDKKESKNAIKAKAIEKNFVGGSYSFLLELKDGEIFTSHAHRLDCPVNQGDIVYLDWDKESAIIVDWSD